MEFSIYEFPKSVIERMGYYVYILKNPLKDNTVFYIGKGTGNRIFAHVNAALEQSHDNDKLAVIRSIHAQQQHVVYEILRHGLTEKEAFQVESALIDYIGLDDLANKVVGHHAHAQGRMSISDIIATYRAEAITVTEPSLFIIVNRLFQRGMNAEQLYEITRGNWVLGLRRNRAKFAFTIFRGVVREVYTIQDWQLVQARNPAQKQQSRWRFTGELASHLHHYVGGNVEAYLKRGAQSPIKYINC